VIAVSLVSLVGLAVLSGGEARVRRTATALVAFAVGTLLGDSFIHLLPEAFAGAGPALAPSLLVLAGLLLFFVVEKLLRHRHRIPHHGPCAHEDARRELAAINVVGDALHNLMDGAVIAASYLVSPRLGLATTLAVLFHEIPQELGDFGVLVHSGLGVRKAVRLNLLSAGAAGLGALVALAAGSVAGAWVARVAVPMAAGGFVYIAAADLIPELQHDRSLRGLLGQSALITAGIAVMAALTMMESP
jgi:zinc and cadmium transporter